MLLSPPTLTTAILYFFGLPKYQISKLQKVQNTAARLVTKSKRSASITPILKRLHWLPVQERIRYKILLITYRAMKGLAPDYIVLCLKCLHLGLVFDPSLLLVCLAPKLGEVGVTGH